MERSFRYTEGVNVGAENGPVPGERVRVASVAAAVPGTRVDNRAELTPLVGATKAEAIVTSTGFSARRVAAPGQTVRDLLRPAARAALSGVDPATVGAVVSVSFSHPARFPGLAVQLSAELGISATAPVVDLSAACSGYPYGLFVASQFVRCTGKPVLLLDGDVQTPCLDPDDAATRAVLSDAGTATLLTPEDAEHAPAPVYSFFSKAQDGAALTCRDGRLVMDGFGVFRFVALDVAAFLRRFLAETGGAPQVFVPHQANLYMVRQLAKTLGLADRLCVAGAAYGNPGSCSVPLALAAQGPVGEALLAGFGAGLSAAAVRLQLPSDYHRTILEV